MSGERKAQNRLAVNYVEAGNTLIYLAHRCEFVAVNRRVREFLEQHDESEA